jgi:hypothetical protein
MESSSTAAQTTGPAQVVIRNEKPCGPAEILGSVATAHTVTLTIDESGHNMSTLCACHKEWSGRCTLF